jgi:hypothetical protein
MREPWQCHCEERSRRSTPVRGTGLLRFARNDLESLFTRSVSGRSAPAGPGRCSRRSDSTRNSFSAGTNILNNVAQHRNCGHRCDQNPRRGSGRERNFGIRRPSAKNGHSNAKARAETRIQKLSCQKSLWKRPIWRRPGNVWFARAGWWCAQSNANRSPRKFPANRENNREFRYFGAF